MALKLSAMIDLNFDQNERIFRIVIYFVLYDSQYWERYLIMIKLSIILLKNRIIKRYKFLTAEYFKGIF